MTQAYIIDGYRTPVGKAHKGSMSKIRSDDFATDVIRKLIDSVPNLDPSRVDDLIVGCAYPEGEQGMQMGRLISLMALPLNVSGFIVNRFCASGLEAIAIASQRIQSGMADIIIAGGTESMSLIPRNGYHLSHNPQLIDKHPEYLISMGLTAENVAQHYNISRERQDQFSFQSHQKALHAQQKQLFQKEIVPIKTQENLFLEQDESIRPTTSLKTLADLSPVFKDNGTVTAGNSSPLNDGAAFVLIVSDKVARELNLEPKSKMLGYTTVGVHPSLMGIGPVQAVKQVLKQTQLSQENIDLIELNEAFAAQALAVIDELNLNPEITNVNGGAIALGHPLGATGAKLTIQLTNEMHRRGNKYGLVTACVGGGQGVAAVFEKI